MLDEMGVKNVKTQEILSLDDAFLAVLPYATLRLTVLMTEANLRQETRLRNDLFVPVSRS